jgi:hypothetical protein
VSLLAGCSAIPEGGDPAPDPRVRALAAAGGAKLGRLAVAPVTTLAFTTDEGAKGWKVSESPAIGAERLRASLLRALDASGRFERVRAASADALGEAWREHDDLVARVSIDNLATHYDGHNGWWIPNLANWLFWIVPSWFVATEEYSLTFDATVTLASGESGSLVAPPRTIPIKVSGTFDEFDRGWQFFGFIAPSLDASVWREIATKLFPAAERELAVAVATTSVEVLTTAQGSRAFVAARRKTVALAIGISRYKDPVQLPPLPYASDDARAVSDALVRRGIPREHVLTLTDGAATVAAVRSSVLEHLGRAREGDMIVVYFAGYGTREKDGAPTLLLHEAGGQGEGRLGLDELARLVESASPGTKLIVLDAAFGGRERSVPGGAAGERDDLAAFGPAPGLAAILPGPSDPALAPEHLASGLLTYHLLRGLRGAADEDHDGCLTSRELFQFVRPRVVAEAALAGEVEEPRAVGLDRGFVLDAPADPRAR